MYYYNPLHYKTNTSLSMNSKLFVSMHSKYFFHECNQNHLP